MLGLYSHIPGRGSIPGLVPGRGSIPGLVPGCGSNPGLVPGRGSIPGLVSGRGSISRDFSLADHTLPTRCEPAWRNMVQSPLVEGGLGPTMDIQRLI